MRYVFLILLLLCIIYFYNKQNTQLSEQKEHFQWDPLWVGNTSLDCYGERPQDCLSYSNCGLCDGKCFPGDQDGGFFDTGCRKWKYTNYYDNYIFNEKATNTVQSWDKMQPGYEVRFPMPVSWSALE